MRTAPYPKPGPTGGRLIRELIAGLRGAGLELPLSSHILIAVSGGVDSTALGHLVAKYGRRVGARESITFLHVNHGWRGAESEGDARFVERLGRKLGVPVLNFELDARPRAGESPEEAARRARKSIFEREAKRLNAVILTAHHADDLAETVLWRLFTGAGATHGAGILPRLGQEVRPLLGVRKALLRKYLEEERQRWREDRTNHEGKLLRSRMRLELMPGVEKLFPRAIENLSRFALDKRERVPILSAPSALLQVLEGSGLRIRRAHWQMLERKHAQPEPKSEPWQMHLPDGWLLRRESKSRWVLTKS